MEFVGELWRFMRVRKKYWLAPILMMMALFGGLLALTQGSAVAPFVLPLAAAIYLGVRLRLRTAPVRGRLPS